MRPDDAPPVTLPIQFGNTLAADSYGVEIEARWRVRPWWRLVGSYSFLAIDAGTGTASDLYSNRQYEGASPRHQVHVRSGFDLPHAVELDVLAFWVDALDFSALGQPNRFPAYWRLDTRVACRPWEALELAVVGQNLLDERHAEFTNTSRGRIDQTQVERGVYGEVTWRL